MIYLSVSTNRVKIKVKLGTMIAIWNELFTMKL